jgi:hypothetical protein
MKASMRTGAEILAHVRKIQRAEFETACFADRESRSDEAIKAAYEATMAAKRAAARRPGARR